MKLTTNQLEVLEQLEWLRDRPDQCDFSQPYVDGVRQTGFASPLRFGGFNGSHHSNTATALAKRGLVDRAKNGKLNGFNSRNKGSCSYRITNAGIAALVEHRSALTDRGVREVGPLR